MELVAKIKWLCIYLALTFYSWSEEVSTYQPYRSFTPSATADQIWKSLMAQTNNPIQSAGIMGNIGIESSFDEDIVNQAENAFGLLQLRGDRLDNFRKFQQSNPGNLIDQQIKFIFEQGNPDSPYKDGIAAKYFNDIMSQKDPMQVARMFDKRFERSAGWLVDPNNPDMGYNEFGKTTKDRMNLANDIFGYYSQRNPGNQSNNIATNQQPKNFIGKIRDAMTDPGFSSELRLWANSMRLKPDQNLALALAEDKKAREEKRLLNIQKTASMNFIQGLPGTEKDYAMSLVDAGLEMKEVLSSITSLRYKSLDTEQKLANTFAKEEPVKKFIGRADALGTILSNARNPTQAGDIAIVFTYMKMLDPTSTVNKGELALAQNVGDIAQRGWALYNSLITGTANMSDLQRKGLVNSAFNTYKESKKSYQKTYDHYVNLATRYQDRGFNIDAENFAQKHGLSSEQYQDMNKVLIGWSAESELDERNVEIPFKQNEVNFDVLRNHLVENMPAQLEVLNKNNDNPLTLDEFMEDFDAMSEINKFKVFKRLYLNNLRLDPEYDISPFLKGN